LRDIHAGVNYGSFPDNDQFDAIVENLIATLKIKKVSQSDIEEVMTVVCSIRNDILGLDDEGEKEVLNEKPVISHGFLSK